MRLKLRDLWGRRVKERLLLLLAVPVVLVPAMVYGLADPRPDTFPLAADVALLLALFFAAHAALVAADFRGDPFLLPIACVLVGLGCVEIRRIDPALGHQQVMWLAAGLVAMMGWLAVVRDYRRLEDLKYVLLAGAVMLQLLVMLVGTEVNGARLWIRVGSWSFQPVEIVKLLLVGFLAAYLRQNRPFLTMKLWGEERALTVRYFLPLVAMAVGAELIFVVQRDLGQGLLFFGVFLTSFYAATRRLGLVLVSLAAFGVVSWVCYHLFGHVRVRFAAWTDPWQDPHGWGYQIVQGLYSLASGGWFGSGVWRGQPWRIPDAHTDFIFVSLVEELGTVAMGAFLACVGLLVVRAFRAARAAADDFGALLACGVGAVLGLQAFLIVAGSTKMIPITGITLPFVSYGGSSLLANFLMLALLLQISHRAAVGEVAARPELDRGLRAASIFYFLLLLSPIVYLLWFRLGPSGALAASGDNPRTREDLRARGGIVDRRGESLARSEGLTQVKAKGMSRDAWRQGTVLAASAPWVDPGEASRRRYVPSEAFGPLLGYRSLVLGSAGIEKARDATLRGTIVPRTIIDAVRLMAGGDLRGSSLVLTIDAGLQRLAYRALDGRRGAVVMLDPRNGEILALVSSPGFDSSRVEKQWTRLRRDKSTPLLDRALQGTYPPGSALKPAVVAIALDRGAAGIMERFSCGGVLEVNGHRLHDFSSGGHGTVDLDGAVAWSCNVVLASVGLRLDVGPFLDGLRAAGLGEVPPVELDAVAGSLPPPASVTPEMLAQMAFGQGPVVVSPMQMALVTAGIANDGRIMTPTLVRAVRSPSGREEKVPPSVWKEPFTPGTSRAVGQMMESVVARGTGTAAQVSGVRVAGKTGTAENPHGASHAWFVGFAPVQAPRVVVVVLVENAGSGGIAAAPIARQLLEAALAEPGGS